MSAIEVETKDKSLWVRTFRRDFMEEMNPELSLNLWSAYCVPGAVLNIDGIKLSKIGTLPL